MYLNPELRGRLLAPAAEAVPVLLLPMKSVLIGPVRPGALAALTVADYDPASTASGSTPTRSKRDVV